MKKENTYKIIRTKPELSSTLLLVITFNLFLIIFQFYYIALISSLFTFFFLFRTSGFILDKENHRIKKVKGFAGFTTGQWHTLPSVKYVSLLRIKQASNSSYGTTGIANSERSFGYQINLVVQVNREKRRYKLMTTKLDKAKEEGKRIGEFMDLKVLDSTSHKRRWIA